MVARMSMVLNASMSGAAMMSASVPVTSSG
jgi:hypothetical protein